MKKFLLLLLFIPFLGNAQITLPSIPDMVVCDDTDSNSQNGQKAIDIIGYITPFLSNYPSPAYTQKAYTTQANAQSGTTGVIINPSAYTATNGQVLYIRVENPNTGEYGITPLAIIINLPPLLTQPTMLSLCNEALPNDNVTTFDLTVKNNEITGPNCIGCTVTFYEQSPLQDTVSPIANPTAYTNPPQSGNLKTLFAKVQNALGCVAYTTLVIKVLPLPGIIGGNFPTLYSCTNTYNLTVNSNLVGTNTISYFTTQDDANLNINPIVNPQSYTGVSPVWARLSLDTGNPAEPKCARVVVQNLQNISTAVNLADGAICTSYNGTAESYLLETGLSASGWTFSWYKNGVLLANAFSNSYSASTPGTYSVTATNTATGCQATDSATVFVSGQASPIGLGYTINGQNVHVSVAGYGQYVFQLDNNPNQNSLLFENVLYGQHTILVTDLYGCGILALPFVMIPPAPTGNSEQFFIAGETLDNLVVQGENIKWYSTPTGGSPLLITTSLTDGMIAYASQTIGNIESTQRLMITVSPGFEIGTPNNLMICVPMGESVGAFDLTLNDDVLLNGLNPAEYTVEYAAAPANDPEFIPISNPSQYTNIISSQGIVARVTKNNNPNNYKLSVSFTLNVGPIPVINSISNISIIDENGDGIEAVDLTLTTAEILGNQPPEVNTITFYTTAAEANAGVSPIADPQEFLTSTETIFFRIERMEGCYSTGSFYVTVLSIPAPTGETDQTFEPGGTLADIEVEGENILWYDNNGTVTGPPTGMGTPLPLTTVLEDGKTYYASQTVGGYESQERLPVTVHILLGIDSNTLSGLQYYPNPVKNTVTFSNTSNIDTIAIVNITGQRVISKSIDNTTAQIDLSGLSEGIYFAKIASDGKTKTIKIIKE